MFLNIGTEWSISDPVTWWARSYIKTTSSEHQEVLFNNDQRETWRTITKSRIFNYKIKSKYSLVWMVKYVYVPTVET